MGWTGLTKRFHVGEANRARTGKPALVGDEVLGQFALGEYELLKKIGEGSNGEVYLARPRSGSGGQYVVVKRVKQQLLQSSRFRQFFDGEVKSMKRFKHPYVVQLIDATLDDPIGPCLVLEYIHGYTLEAILEKYPRWYPDRLARIVGQICHALQAAHDAGIMHRDMKPANLMLVGFNTPQEMVKVMDFGFAGFTERPHIPIAELTGHGPVFACGTPAYVSPEMVRGDAVDGRADLYGLGAMLYEMLTGRLPFDMPTVSEIMMSHVKKSPPSFYKLGLRDIPPAVEAVVQLALAKFPAERHQSGKDLAKHYGNAVGQHDLWNETAPANYDPPEPPKTDTIIVDKTLMDAPPPGSTEDKFTLYDQFEAQLSPKMAAAKIRGFTEDVNGTVIASEPGVIRMQVGMPQGYTAAPPTRSGLLSFINAIRKPTVLKGEEPIDLTMQMQNLETNLVAVFVSFKPVKDYMPDETTVWKSRCEELYALMRSYLMAS